MPDGLSTTNANLAANAAVGSNAAFAALAKGDPGSAGTANPSSVTTREAVAWGSASGGAVSTTSVGAWTAWAGTNGEVVTDLAFWSLVSGGTFGLSMQLASSVTMNTGDSLTVTAATVTFPTAS